MREGWREASLAELARYDNGYPFKPSELGSEGLPVVRIKQLLDPTEPVDRSTVAVPPRNRLNDGDLVFSWSGTLAVRLWNRGPALLNQHLFRVVERDDVLREWLCLALDHAITALESKAHGTTMRHITKPELERFHVVVPGLPEQRRIVDIVSSSDSMERALREQVNATDGVRRALVSELFASGRPLTLGDLVVLDYGGALPGGCRSGGGFPVFGSAGVVGYHDPPTVRQGPVIVVGRKGVHAGGSVATPPRDDVGLEDAFGYRGTGGAGSVRWCSGPCTVIDTAYVARLRADVDARLVYWALVAADLQAQTTKTTLPGLSREAAYRVASTLPSSTRAAPLLDALDAIDEVFVCAWKAMGRIRAARKSLLSALLSGNHEIPASYDRFLDGAA